MLGSRPLTGDSMKNDWTEEPTRVHQYGPSVTGNGAATEREASYAQEPSTVIGNRESLLALVSASMTVEESGPADRAALPVSRDARPGTAAGTIRASRLVMTTATPARTARRHPYRRRNPQLRGFGSARPHAARARRADWARTFRSPWASSPASCWGWPCATNRRRRTSLRRR
jgi:hypothetical protein